MEVDFKSISIDLIKQDMKIYLDDKEAHKVAKLESFKNQEWDYVGYVIQYCLEDKFIKYLMKLNDIDTKDFFNKKPLFVPSTDGDKINFVLIHDTNIVGFYYNKANRNVKLPMKIQEIREMQILHYYTKWDPEGLIEMNAPKDEYYYEINQIWKKIKENTTTEELALIIEEVTEETFGGNYNKKGTDILEIANNIDSLNK